MCPQKWNASASPGRTSARTAVPPAASVRTRDTRARNPRRDVEVARPSAEAVTSGMRLCEASLRGRDDALELPVRVERPLRVHRARAVERDRERTTRDPERLPDVGVLPLVEDLDRAVRLVAKRGDARSKLRAQPTPGRGEDREPQRHVEREPVERDARPERRS